MTRITQVSLVILAAILCAGLAACQSQPTTPAVVSMEAIKVGLIDQFPSLQGGRVHLEDTAYSTIPDSAVWRAVNASWRPYQAQSWDCDDQASAALYELRLANYGHTRAPAAGRLSGLVRGHPHAAVWWINHAGDMKFLDVSSRSPLSKRDIEPWRAFDK